MSHPNTPRKTGSIHALWKTLPSEPVVLTREDMQLRITTLKAKVKRRDINEYLGFAVLFVLIAYVHSLNSGWENWVISGLMTVGAIAACWNYRRRAGGSAMAPLSASENLTQFIRRELIRQRDAAATFWRWYILPFVPAIVFICVLRWVETGPDLYALTPMRINVLMVAALCVAVGSAFILWQWLQAASYQRQIEDLGRMSGHEV